MKKYFVQISLEIENNKDKQELIDFLNKELPHKFVTDILYGTFDEESP